MGEKENLIKEIYELELTAEHDMKEKFYLLELKAKLNEMIYADNYHYDEWESDRHNKNV